MSTLGTDCLSQSKRNMQFVHAAIYDSRYSLPRRIAGMVDIKEKLRQRLDETSTRYYNSLWDDILDEHHLTSIIFPVAKTFIYCAPCACLILTAVLVCDRAASTVHEYFIRPDDRLESSCCLGQDRITGLRSIYNAVKHNEAQAGASKDHNTPIGTKYIDMLWLEERLHSLDAEDEYVEFESQPLGNVMSRVVIIGEPDFLRPITRKMSCSRVPREAEIWQLQFSPGTGPWKYKFFGTYTIRVPAMLTKPTPTTTSSSGTASSATAPPISMQGFSRETQTVTLLSHNYQAGSQASSVSATGEEVEDTEGEGRAT